MDNLSGQQIKGYELRERIGTGGFGAVYKAQQSTVNREVAIKIILPHFSNHPDFIRRFENEAQLVARLEHLHIVPLYDYWRDPDGAYLVMRWLRGGSLRDALQKGPFTAEQAASLMDQLSAALSAAHRSHVIHRDLKPGNILLDEDGNAYLADFGIAKDLSLSAGVTEPDAIIGSPDYLAPEQARGEIVTPATDVYSLGVVLYEMLIGEHPFPNLNSVERLYKHLNEPIPLISNLPEDIRSAVNDVIQKATAKNPIDRYDDVLDMATAFRTAARTRTPDNIVETLTLREQEILRLIINGHSNKQVAEALFLALNTVKWYVTQIYQKLGVRTRVQAIVRARELHLIGGVSAGENIAIDLKTVIPTDEFHPLNPYKGLRSFQAADNQEFFGREKLIEKLIKRMSEVSPQRLTTSTLPESEMGRFLAVVGPSGSGKSSLVKAGLIAALWRGDIPGSEKWFVVEMLPGTHPIDELEVALTRVAANQASNLREQLERDERGLVRAAQLILPNDGTELVIVIDQFEEVFTLVTDEHERVQFLKLIQNAVSDLRSHIRVVVTLRADFYDRPLHYAGIGELFRSRIETILPLTADGLERAISQPAERVGVRFEPGLVAKIISEVNYQPGALPLLQYALTELFELRKGRLLTLEAYQAIGGSVGALAKRVDELYLSMSAAGQEAAKQMFMRLVTLGEGVEDTRRRVARSELLAITADPEIMDEVIDTFAEYRLLSLDNDPNTRTPTIEVAHEAILREWERLRGWLNDSREDIKLQRQLASTAHEWEHSGREPSFLLRGSRLTALAKWSADTKLALTDKEHHYLQESLDEQHQQLAKEIERQARVKALEQRSIRFLRILVAVLLLAVLGAFGLTGAAVNQSSLTQQALATSDANFRHAEQIRLAAQAQNLMNDGSPGNLPALLALASLRFGYSEQADAALLKASSLGIIKRLFPSTSISNGGVFSPDGKRAVTIGTDHLGRVWDIKSGAEIMKLTGPTDLLNTVAYAPNGQYIVAAGYEKIAWLWDAQSGKQLRQLTGHTDQIWNIAISPNSQYILTCGGDKTIRFWDAQSGKEVHEISLNATAAFSPDGQYVATGGEEKITLWDMQTWKEIRHFDAHVGLINSLLFSPDSKALVISSDDKTLRLWDIQTGSEIRKFTGHTSWVGPIDFSQDGDTLISGGGDNTIRFWDVQSGNELKQFYSRDTPASLDLSPDGKYVLTNGQPSAYLWDAQFKSEPEVIQVVDPTQDEGPWRIKYSADQRYLLTAGPTSAQIWDAKNMKKLYELRPTTSIRDAVLSPDGKYLFASTNGPDTNTYLYEVATGKTIQTFVGHTAEINEVDYSPDGKYGSTSSFDNTAIVWDIQTGKIVRRFEGHAAALGHSIFSSDSQRLLTGCTDGTLRLWDIATGELLKTFEDHAAGDMNLAFSPDDKRIASNHFDGTFRIWDVESGKVIHNLSGYSGMTWGVMFSHDGRYLLGSDMNRDVRLWDTQTGELVRVYSGHTGGIHWATFSPDEKQILAVGGGDLVIWQRDYSDIVNAMCAELPTDFTPEERQAYDIPPAQQTCPQFATTGSQTGTKTG